MMKALVVDDNPVHRAAAKAQLTAYNLTVAESYEEAEKLVGGSCEYDVVLVDLFLPASRRAQGPEGERFVGQEMPIGIFLALLAAKNGAKYVAVFTDTSHHAHPTSACLDSFWGADPHLAVADNRREGYPVPFVVGGAKFLLSNNRGWVKPFLLEDLSREMPRGEYFEDRARAEEITVRAKDWRSLADYLLRA